MNSRWRTIAAPLIADALRATEGMPEKERRRHLREAYPFGPRRYWPYKAWLAEVRAQLRPPPPPEPEQLELLP